MKNHRITELLNHRIPYSVILLFSYSVIASAAVPLSWTVETSRAQPATFEAYQGETIDFEASLQSHGKPLEAPLNYSFFWQTNGMGNAYWEAPCKSGEAESFPLQNQSTNVLFATWIPSMDVGAKVYNCFIGSPSNIYHAAFQLRLRPSPGATPNALPLPTPVIDFAKIRVLNPPWEGGGGGGVDTNTVEWIANRAVETNAVTVGLSSSVSSLQSSKADQSEVDQMQETLGDAYSMAASASSWVAATGQYKADRAESGDADEIATLDADGNPTRSGIAASRIETVEDTAGQALETAMVAGDEAHNANEAISILYTEDLPLKADRSMISATDETFSNAVLAVGLNIDTNSVAVLNEIAATFGDFPIAGTATTVGGLLAALAAAVAWLKKRAAHLDDGGLADDTFATDLLGKQVAKEAIRANSAQLALDEDGEIIVTMNTED